jgi:hypothetical protein
MKAMTGTIYRSGKENVGAVIEVEEPAHGFLFVQVEGLDELRACIEEGLLHYRGGKSAQPWVYIGFKHCEIDAPIGISRKPFSCEFYTDIAKLDRYINVDEYSNVDNFIKFNLGETRFTMPRAFQPTPEMMVEIYHRVEDAVKGSQLKYGTVEDVMNILFG